MNYPDDFINKLIVGDSFSLIQELPNESIDVVITSPPYWAQRRYTDNNNELGAESTFKEYVQNLASFFDILLPKIKSTGSLWLNLGDSYYGGTKGAGGHSTKQNTNPGAWFDNKKKYNNKELPNKSLCNIPARVSIALQDNAYILRNVIIWHKPNAWVTSAKDRFTVDFEYLFWFVKNPKYYFEQQFEPYKSKKQKPMDKNKQDCNSGYYTYRFSPGKRDYYSKEGRNKRTIWSINTKRIKGIKHFAKFPIDLVKTPILATCPVGGVVLDPFIGSGTTALACKELNRNYIGIDISEEYIKIAEERLND